MDDAIRLANLACLPEYLTELLPSAKTAPSTPPSVQIIRGEQGHPVALYKTGNQTILTNSLHDPWNEAERWAQSINYTGVNVSVIYGCGFGYPLLEYAKRKKRYTETLIFERDIELFDTMLQCIDIRPLLQDPTCHFIVGDLQQMKSQIKNLLWQEFLFRCSNLTACFTWPAHRSEKAPYLALHEWFLNALRSSCLSLGNSIHDTLVGVYNTLENVEAIMHSPQLSSLRSKFSGKPAFIVSNGPSLDKNIDLLAKASEKALILTAESALRPCLKRNIKPDAVAVTERTPNVYHIHFENQQLPDELTLIGLSLIDPRIPKTFHGSWIPVFRSGETSAKWIQKTVTEEEFGLHSGSSSAHLAFEFALWAGANPIIFVGQDLAFGTNKATHSQLSAYAEGKLDDQIKFLLEQPTYYVPGINGTPVLTTRQWDEFKTWFEDQINRHPEVRFIDATEGGAYIRGTELMTLQEAITAFCKESLDTRLYEYAHKISPVSDKGQREKKYQTLLKQLSDIRGQLDLLAHLAKDDIQNCRIVERACALHSKHPETVLPSFVETLVRNNAMSVLKFTNLNIAPYTQQILFALHKQINDVGEVTDVANLHEATKLYRKMFEYLQQICTVMIHHFTLAEHKVRKWMETLQ